MGAIVENKNSINVGKGLRYWRKKRGYRQTDLSKKSGYSQTYISEIESGKKVPTLDFLYQISKHLRIRIVQLFWQSMEEKDFRGSNKENFKALKPNIDKMFGEFFNS
jgi:transcriptional regulator with XRE-family HTH domain